MPDVETADSDQHHPGDAVALDQERRRRRLGPEVGDDAAESQRGENDNEPATHDVSPCAVVIRWEPQASENPVDSMGKSGARTTLPFSYRRSLSGRRPHRACPPTSQRD